MRIDGGLNKCVADIVRRLHIGELARGLVEIGLEFGKGVRHVSGRDAVRVDGADILLTGPWHFRATGFDTKVT